MMSYKGKRVRMRFERVERGERLVIEVEADGNVASTIITTDLSRGWKGAWPELMDALEISYRALMQRVESLDAGSFALVLLGGPQAQVISGEAEVRSLPDEGLICVTIKTTEVVMVRRTLEREIGRAVLEATGRKRRGAPRRMS